MSMFQSLQKAIKGHHLLALVAVVIIAYAIYRYSSDKSSQKLGMTDGSAPSTVESAKPSGDNSMPSEIENSASVPAKMGGEKKETLGASELLPAAGETEFSKVNPASAQGLMGQNFLKAGQHIGVNTIGSSMRNANLQIRSEPANPQGNVGPWNQTTIGPNLMQRPLDCNTQ